MGMNSPRGVRKPPLEQAQRVIRDIIRQVKRSTTPSAAWYIMGSCAWNVQTHGGSFAHVHPTTAWGTLVEPVHVLHFLIYRPDRIGD